MTTKVGSIVVDIDARLTSLEANLAKADRSLGRFEKNTMASGSRIEQSLVGLGKGFGTVAGSIAGLAAVAGVNILGNLGKDILDYADDLGTAADQAGIGVERFQTLRESFRALEVDGAAFDKAMKRLVTTLGDVQNGVKDEATKALDQMGISSRILSGEISTTDGLLDAIAGSAKSFATEAEFTSAIVDIFGRKVGPEMAAALADGGAALADLEAQLIATGGVITTEQIEKLAEANETIDRFAAKTKITMVQWAASLIPILEDAGIAWLDFGDRINETYQRVKSNVAFLKGALTGDFSDAIEAADKASQLAEQRFQRRRGQAARQLPGVLKGLGFNFQDAKPEPTPITPRPGSSGRSKGAGRSARAGLTDAEKFDQALAKLTERQGELTQKIAETNDGLDRASMAYNDAVFAAEAYIKANEKTLTAEQVAKYREQARALGKLERDLINAAEAQAKFNEVLPANVNDVDLLTDSVLKLDDNVQALAANSAIALSDLGQDFLSTFSRIEGAARGFAQSLKSGDILGSLLGFVDVLSTVLGALGSAGIIGSGFGTDASFDKLAASNLAMFGGPPVAGARAAGGPVTGGKTYLVGEKGPELFSPSSSGSIIPNSRLSTGGFKGGGASVRIVPSKYFDAVVDGRASAVAAPMAIQSAASGSFGAQTALARKQRRRLA